MTLLPAELTLDVTCRNCGAALHARVPQVIDLATQPRMRAALVGGRAQDVACLHCEAISRFSMAFVVWEPTQHRVIAFSGASDWAPYAERFRQLARSLGAVQPAASGAPLRVCTSQGALADALLEGFWDDPASAGLQAEGPWKGVYQRLPTAARIQVLDLLAEGGQRAVLLAAEQDPALGAALRFALDPDRIIYTDALEAAVLAAGTPDAFSPDALTGILLQGLADCARHPQDTRGMRGRFLAALTAAAQRMEFAEDDVSVANWASWPNRLPEALPDIDKAIVLFNQAGSAFDRLAGPPYATPMARALTALFQAVLAHGPPADLAPMARDRLGRLRIDSVPPDPRGADDLREAAQGFEAIGRPIDALFVWRRLLRWHGQRTGGRNAGEDPLAEAEAACAAGAAALKLSACLPLQEGLELAREVVRWASSMPGDNRGDRLRWAAEISRGVLAKIDQTGVAGEQLVARCNLAGLLLETAGGDDVVLVEEAVDLLLPWSDAPILTAEPHLRMAYLTMLALAYKRRTVGDAPQNMENAIDCYRQAIGILKGAARSRIETDARDIPDGSLRYNLGNAMLRRLRGDRASNYAEAARIHETLRRERQIHKAHAQLQARSWLSVANVHSEWAELSTPPDPTHLRKAVRGYRLARQQLDGQDVPRDAALAVMLEGQAHARLPRTGPRRRAALDCYARAAVLAASAGDQVLQEDIAARRGSLLFLERRLAEAAEAYAEAFRFRRALLAQAVSGLTRERQLSAIAPYGARLAYALILTGRVDAAIDALRAARALDLVEALRGVQSDTLDATRYRAARAQVLALETQEALTRDGSGGSPHGLHQQLQVARAELEMAAKALCLPDENTGGSGYAMLVAQAGSTTLLAVPVVTDIGSVIVFAAPGQRDDSQAPYVVVDSVRSAHLRALLGLDTAAAEASVAPGGAAGESWRQIVAAIASAEPALDRAALADRMETFFLLLGEFPIVAALRQRLAETGAREIRLVLQGGLQSLPLSMALDPAGGKALSQQVTVTTQIGLVPRSHRGRAGAGPARPMRLLLVADPQDNLPFARWEAALIVAQAAAPALGARAPEIEKLYGHEATREALIERVAWADILHFAGHAGYDWERPARSGLCCADTVLSVEVLRAATLRAPLRLVVLSACDTGLTEMQRLPDEFIGLPAAFLALGAEAVIGSMWSLPDEATAVLMGEFYREILAQGASYSAALATAQRRLATETAANLDLAGRLDALYEASGRRDGLLARRALAHRRRPQNTPYAHPLFWGAHMCLQA